MKPEGRVISGYEERVVGRSKPCFRYAKTLVKDITLRLK
jgi:hypothetical protein